MEEKLIKLYAQCVNELKSIGIDLGKKRNSRRYRYKIISKSK